MDGVSGGLGREVKNGGLLGEGWLVWPRSGH